MTPSRLAGRAGAVGVPLLALLACVAVLALQVHATAIEDHSVFTFGARGPKDTELYRQIVKKKTRFYSDGRENVKYPAAGSTKNVVTSVEVRMPRHWMQDDVRITSGGPGMNHVTVSIGGHHGITTEYTVIVFGKDVDGIGKLGVPGVPGVPPSTQRTRRDDLEDYPEGPADYDDSSLDDAGAPTSPKPGGPVKTQPGGHPGGQAGGPYGRQPGRPAGGQPGDQPGDQPGSQSNHARSQPGAKPAEGQPDEDGGSGGLDIRVRRVRVERTTIPPAGLLSLAGKKIAGAAAAALHPQEDKASTRKTWGR